MILSENPKDEQVKFLGFKAVYILIANPSRKPDERGSCGSTRLNKSLFVIMLRFTRDFSF